MIGKYGQEEADKALPDYLVSSVQEESIREEYRHTDVLVPDFNENNVQPEGEPAMSAEEKAELDRLRQENEQLKATKAKAEAEKAEAELNSAKAENASFAEALISEGKLAPKNKDKVVSMLNAMTVQAQGGVVEFEEGESLVQQFKAYLKDQPKVVEFSEVATKDKVHSLLTRRWTMPKAQAQPALMRINAFVLIWASTMWITPPHLMRYLTN